MAQETFDRFRGWLHPNRNLAGEKYEVIHRGQAQFFERLQSFEAEVLVDETIDHMIKKGENNNDAITNSDNHSGLQRTLPSRF